MQQTNDHIIRQKLDTLTQPPADLQVNPNETWVKLEKKILIRKKKMPVWQMAAVIILMILVIPFNRVNDQPGLQEVAIIEQKELLTIPASNAEELFAEKVVKGTVTGQKEKRKQKNNATQKTAVVTKADDGLFTKAIQKPVPNLVSAPASLPSKTPARVRVVHINEITASKHAMDDEQKTKTAKRTPTTIQPVPGWIKKTVGQLTIPEE